MAHKKAGGTAKNLTKSNPHFLGVKLYGGEFARAGNIIVRQRGSKMLAGDNTKMGKDHTIFAIKDGVVNFSNRRKIGFDKRKKILKEVSVK